MNKKGAISVETIIIIILALVVLVILAAAFAGGFTELWKRIFGVSQTITGTNRDLAVQSCNVFCTLKQAENFCRQMTVEGVQGTINCRSLVTCTEPSITQC